MANFLNLLGIWCLFKIALVSSWPVVLDKESDVKGIMWKVKGYSFYLPDGKALRGRFHEYLPTNFTYKNFAMSEGIWTVVPNLESSCELFGKNWDLDNSSSEEGSACNVTSTGKFQFKAVAQLASNVKVKYCFGGNATIRINGAKGEPFVESANGRDGDEWIETEVPLDGRTMDLEATAYSNGDYVLIDRITVEILPASTTPRPSKPTTAIVPSTSTEQPMPASGQESIMTSSRVAGLIFVAILSVSFN